MPSAIRSTGALVSVNGAGGLVRLAIVVVVCTGLAAVINRWGHLRHGRDDVLAALRACLQLGVVGLLILAVLRSWWLTLGFITLMLSVASLTAGRRLTRQGAWWLASVPVVLGSVTVASGLMLSGIIPRQP
ncbi:MAG: ABC transporter permease, partial [Dermatophilaceae bacterium]